MQKVSKILILALALVFCFSLAAQAGTLVSVTSINGGDFKVTDVNGDSVFEDYNENTLILYPSHDGTAIVNANRQFFDKTVVVEKSARNQDPEKVTTTWHVTNTTNYSWSDYHWIILDNHSNISFTNPLNSSDFKLQGPDPIPAEPFWEVDFSIGAPGSKFTDPTETNNFTISFDIFGGNQGDQFTFTLRQIATTETLPPGAPIPGSLLLLGSGLVGLLGLRRRL